jgi:prepilin-type N-terminal cleavage/methylation domain-containing protein
MMNTMTRRPASSGFTLIEMLVAIAVFTILMIGLLNLLDNSTRVSKIEAALADTQENVRYATYHLMRTARMMGGSIMPFARGDASGNAWVAGEVHDNVATNFSIFGTTLENMPGSDVLVLRGFFDVAPFFISEGDVNAAGRTVTIREHADAATASPRLINDLSPYATLANAFLNRGLIISTSEGPTQAGPNLFLNGQYIVGQITASSGVAGTAPFRQLVLNYGPNAAWDGLNFDGSPIGSPAPAWRNASRAGIVEAYAYYVDTNRVMRRLAQRDVASGNGPQPVAVNIGNIQVELGIDADSDTFLNPVSEWDASPTLAEALQGNGVVAMRLTVLGRTPDEVPGWTEPTRTFAGAGNMTAPVAGSSGPRHAKWRRMEVAVALRNFL